MVEREQGTILYGMMGCGKTTLGGLLAIEFEQPFVDSDYLIEEATGRTCAEIIADPAGDFIAEQAKAVFGYNPQSPEVLATGGSVAGYPELVEHLGAIGVGIFINVDPEELEARLPAERIAALNNPDKLSFADLYAARVDSYIEAAGGLVLNIEPGESIGNSLDRLIDLRLRTDQ